MFVCVFFLPLEGVKGGDLSILSSRVAVQEGRRRQYRMHAEVEEGG